MDCKGETLEDKRKRRSLENAFENQVMPMDYNDPLEPGIETRQSRKQRFLSHLISPKLFALVYIMAYMSLYAYIKYLDGVMTTLEKAFGISGKTMGLILSGNDISSILLGIFLTHFANKGSRPKWMALGVFLTAVSCFIDGSLHALWLDENNNSRNRTDLVPELLMANNQSHFVCNATSGWPQLRETTTEPNITEQSSSIVSPIVLFIAQFSNGISYIAMESLGISYLDDHLKKANSPLFIGFSKALSLSGLYCGSLISSYFLRIYTIPYAQPDFDHKHPLWIGAWWIGFLVIGGVITAISALFLLFPKKMATKTEEESSQPLKDNTKSQSTNFKIKQSNCKGEDRKL